MGSPSNANTTPVLSLLLLYIDEDIATTGTHLKRDFAMSSPRKQPTKRRWRWRSSSCCVVN